VFKFNIIFIILNNNVLLFNINFKVLYSFLEDCMDKLFPEEGSIYSPYYEFKNFDNKKN